MKSWYKDMGEEFVPINRITGQIKTFDEALDEATAYLVRNTYQHILKYHLLYKH